ncbi:hypothetical protein CKO28_00410 [Rhodovibrio sodomensis]|uniref:CMP/dCMP-type deaminase domain-containing protein n=1 Tax=Rhodovibrio sodomensis TaxID=1088 RepID=A0ABS1D959_9PROT|nr:deaminase [Rhodovibrio sodomensis]MBK1666502.1 hypothetical protein [Rhodovibrio sodomensis]
MSETIDHDLELLQALGILCENEGLEVFDTRLAEMVAARRGAEMSNWDHRGMSEAVQKTAYSKDPRRKVGAYISGARNKPIAWGYNGLPRGIDDSPSRLQVRSAKLKLMAHAERNALDNAEQPVVGATLYCTQIPCAECAKSIVQRGISRVVCPEPDQQVSEYWRQDAAISMIQFAEAGVTLEWYEGPALDLLALRRRLYLMGADAPSLEQIAGGLMQLDEETFKRTLYQLTDTPPF